MLSPIQWAEQEMQWIVDEQEFKKLYRPKDKADYKLLFSMLILMCFVFVVVMCFKNSGFPAIIIGK